MSLYDFELSEFEKLSLFMQGIKSKETDEEKRVLYFNQWYFENTQTELIKSSFTSWLISLIYPFIICLITSFFRTLALKCKSKYLYFIQNLMQFL